MEGLDRLEWPRTEAKIRVARASLFAAQALARSLIADEREQEVQEIRDFISNDRTRRSRPWVIVTRATLLTAW